MERHRPSNQEQSLLPGVCVFVFFASVSAFALVFVSCFLLMPIVNFEKHSEWGLEKLHRVASREEREEGYEEGEQLMSPQYFLGGGGGRG